MKRRKPQTPQTPASPMRVRITHEEIMRDLLFPAQPRGPKDVHRTTGRG